MKDIFFKIHLCDRLGLRAGAESCCAIRLRGHVSFFAVSSDWGVNRAQRYVHTTDVKYYCTVDEYVGACTRFYMRVEMELQSRVEACRTGVDI